MHNIQQQYCDFTLNVERIYHITRRIGFDFISSWLLELLNVSGSSCHLKCDDCHFLSQM